MLVHENGLAVTSSVTLKYPDIREIEHSMPTNDDKRRFMLYISIRPFQPLRVHRSPILCVMSYNPERPWVSRYTDSYMTICSLLEIINCYSIKTEGFHFYDNNLDLCKSVCDFKNKSTIALDKMLWERVGSISNDNVNGFAVAIKKYAYKLFIENIGVADDKLCLKDFQTPYILDKNIKLSKNAEKAFQNNTKSFFRQKQDVTNVHFKTQGVVHFDFNKEIYRQYMKYYKDFGLKINKKDLYY